MSRFVIECPVCHHYAEARTGLFSNKHIKCSCGNTIHVMSDRLVSRNCPSCGNTVLYDQAQGSRAKCPVCNKQLISQDSYNTLIHFRCKKCGCTIHASKSEQTITCPVCNREQDVQAMVSLAEEKATGRPSTITFEGDKSTLVWKHPNTDFVTGSQLIVHESQEAIFFRNGEALDSLHSGRHTLETSILPKMNETFPLPMNGNPFHCEVYFVNLATLMNIKWGTNSKVGLYDPASGIHVEIGASGSFNLRVIDARKLLLRLVGTAETLNQSDLFSDGNSGYFRYLVMSHAKAHLAKVIKSNQLDVLELDEHLDLISTELCHAINIDLGEYGLMMPQFYVTNILLPENNENLNRLKQQHADRHLKIQEEKILQATAEAALERKSIEAQTDAKMKLIGAQGEAEAKLLLARAEAEAYRMKTEAEALEMQVKGFSYQQESARQIGLEAMRNAGTSTSATNFVGDMMQLGIGLGTMSNIVDMTKETVTPILKPSFDQSKWNCSCGKLSISSPYCPNCGSAKPMPLADWNCTCGTTHIASNFCPNCGTKRPMSDVGWACSCGQSNIFSNFCPNCGKAKRNNI